MICPASGSTGCVSVPRPTASSLTWTAPRALTHGQQEGSAWNGHFGCTCYHPLFVFNQHGDLARRFLRAGHVHSAEDWRLVLAPVIARYREQGVDLYFRADAAFAKPEIYELLEHEGIRYAIRLPAKQVLQRRIGHLLTRPVGRPPRKPIVTFASCRYQAKGWTRARRVVAKVEWHQGELYPRVGFIVTDLARTPEPVVNFRNGRGTAEQWIKEGKHAPRWTRLSCHARPQRPGWCHRSIANRFGTADPQRPEPANGESRLMACCTATNGSTA
jgi:Transposase DDE domain group 1